MTGMCTIISRLGCCSTRHRPSSSFSFWAATLKRAACCSHGFVSWVCVTVLAIRILREMRADGPSNFLRPQVSNLVRQAGKPYEYMQALMAVQGNRKALRIILVTPTLPESQWLLLDTRHLCKRAARRHWCR